MAEICLLCSSLKIHSHYSITAKHTYIQTQKSTQHKKGDRARITGASERERERKRERDRVLASRRERERERERERMMVWLVWSSGATF
jgi:hypothetical protein